MLQCETSVRKVTILMSLGLMTKLYEENLCDAPVDRVDDRPQTWRMRVRCKQTGESEFELS